MRTKNASGSDCIVAKVAYEVGNHIVTNDVVLYDELLLAGHSILQYSRGWDERYNFIALGDIAFVKLNFNPNCKLVLDKDNLLVTLVATRRINEGEELTVSTTRLINGVMPPEFTA